VHQNEIRAMLARQPERLYAIAGLQGGVAVRLEQVVEELHIELIVFDDENRFRHVQFLVTATSSSGALPDDRHEQLNSTQVTPSEYTESVNFCYAAMNRPLVTPSPRQRESIHLLRTAGRCASA